jgi:hypothetical protein
VNSGKSYLIAFFALTTVGGGLFAWRQYRELEELRSGALGQAERGNLQKRLWALEKTNRELSDELAALRAGSRDPESAGNRAAARGGGGIGNQRGGRAMDANNPRDTLVRDLLAKPEVQAVIGMQQKLQIEQRYAALFRNLNLSSEQAEKLKSLLMERQNSAQDVLTVAREQGIDPRSDRAGFQKLLADARDDVDNSIKTLLGGDGFSQLQTYENTLPQRNIVDQLQQRLSYTSAPLSVAQAEQLVGILAANTPQRASNPSPAASAAGGMPDGSAGGFNVNLSRGADLGAVAGAFLGGGMGAVLEAGARGTAAPITTTAMSQAQGVLSPPQMTALEQIQQQQQATQQVRQLLNETLMGTLTGGRAGTPPAAPPAVDGKGPRRSP